MSGHWPPEWEDPEEKSPGEADQLDATVLASEAKHGCPRSPRSSPRFPLLPA